MSYCRIHGRFADYYDGCPECREGEERAERDREKQREAAERDREERRAAEAQLEAATEEAEYKRANPGDYKCPECLFITLRRGASRCPTCHATVPSSYWSPIFDRERRDAEEQERRAKLAAKEWAKGEPERQRQAKAAAEQAKAAAEAAAKAASAKRLACFYFGYLLPILGWVTGSLVLYVTNPERLGAAQGTILLFVPVLNWLAYLGLLFFGGNNRPLAWAVLFVWTFAGSYWVAQQTRRA